MVPDYNQQTEAQTREQIDEKLKLVCHRPSLRSGYKSVDNSQ